VPYPGEDDHARVGSSGCCPLDCQWSEIFVVKGYEDTMLGEGNVEQLPIVEGFQSTIAGGRSNIVATLS